MRKILLLVMVAVLPKLVAAQVAIGDSRRSVENNPQFLPHKYAKTSIRVKTDTSYLVMLRGAVKPEDAYFLFNKKQECIFQSFKFECDTCCRQLFQLVLQKKRYNWQAIGVGKYWSKAEEQILLVHDSVRNTVSLQYLAYNHDLYLQLLDKKAGQYQKEKAAGK